MRTKLLSFFLFLALLASANTAFAQTPYYWRGTIDTDWDKPGNWSLTNTATPTAPTTTPDMGDIAIFNVRSTRNCIINTDIYMEAIRLESFFAHNVIQNAEINTYILSVKAGTFTGGTQAINIYDGISISASGNFTSTSGTLTLEGSTFSNQSTFIHNGGTVEFVKSASLTGNIIFNHLKLNANSIPRTISIANTITVAGDLTLLGDDDLSLNTGTLNLTGNLVCNNTGLAGGGSALINFNGQNQTITGASAANQCRLPKLTLNSTGTVTLLKNITLTSDFTNNANNLTANAAGPDASTVIFTNDASTPSSTVSLNRSTTFYNLEVNPALALTLDVNALSTFNVANNLNFGGTGFSVINLNGKTLTVNGNLNFNGPNNSPSTVNNGTIDVKKNITVDNGSLANTGSGIISLTGTTDQQILGNSAISIPNLAINKSLGKVSVNKNLNVGGTLAMTNGNIDMLGSTITLGTGSSLANRGTLNYTSGRIINGTFARWYSDNTAVASSSMEALFPIGTEDFNRTLYISTTSSPTSGGIISVLHDPNVGLTSDINMADATDNNPDQNKRKVLSFLPSSWTITNGTTGGAYDIEMNGYGISPINNLADIRVAKINGLVGTHSTVNGSTTEPILFRKGILTNDLAGTYRIGSSDPNNNPLPVELLSFKAEKANAAVNLTWQTATEKNNDFYTIERSDDGRTFEAIGKVKGAGNSNTLKSYTFADANPVNGISYYRLKQVDFDGKFEYSKIVSVNFDGRLAPASITAYPNPASKVLNIKANGLNGKATLNITDLTGRNVKQIQISTTEANTVNVENLPKGLYQIQVISEEGSTVTKFLKQ